MSRQGPDEHAADYKWKILEGNDGEEWISKPDKNGVYKWRKIQSDNKKSAWGFYAQTSKKPIVDKYDKKVFLTKFKAAKKALSRHHIYFIHLPWNYQYDSGDVRVSAWEIISEKENCDYLDVDDIYSYLAFSDFMLFNSIVYTGRMELYDNILQKDKEKLKEILYKQFGKQLIWPSTPKGSFIIKMKKLSKV